MKIFLSGGCLWAAFVVAGFATPSYAGLYSISDYQETESSTTVPGWFSAPGNHHRLFLDIYNVTDYYDFETSSSAGFVDGTFFADTIRPTVTILWDERFRIQLGVIALKGYGDSTGFRQVDPWIQLLWQPTTAYRVYFGNLDTPHYYLPALFYPLNYVRQDDKETGLQVRHELKDWFDDLYFNYRHQDTSDHPEKFDLGFAHHNAWKFLRFNYQSHWIHEGGELHSRDITTVNDVAQAVGAGIHFDLADNWGLGWKYYYLHSHYRQDATDPALRDTHNGDGDLYEVYARWKRLKLIAQSWFGHSYSHEGGDPLFTVDRMHLFTARWDILLSRDFSVLAEATGYFVGSNDEGIDKVMKSAIHVQATWQFSIPIFEWTTPAASPQGQPVPSRWDEGV
jgi:opacity protein-like surface antigen